MKKTPLKRGNSTLKRTSKLKSNKMLTKKTPDPKYLADRQQQREDDRVFYEALWQKRGPYSEVSKEWLGSEVNKACIHHIVPKSKWGEGRYIEENCILMTIQEHSNVENDPYKYEEINRRREVLKEKYGII